MIEASEVIQAFVAPAILISGCGMLVLSTSARLNAVLGRVRAMHRERLTEYLSEPRDAAVGEVRCARLDGLRAQTDAMIVRAGLLRNTMLLLFVAIVCLVLCSLGVGLRATLDGPAGFWTGLISVIWFVLALVLVAAAMLNSLREMARALDPVRFEHRRIEQMTTQHARAAIEADGGLHA